MKLHEAEADEHRNGPIPKAIHGSCQRELEIGQAETGIAMLGFVSKGERLELKSKGWN